ncbi:hypothetical protein [Methanobacterium alcaliphilum]|uniref:hypothetical protein n=1 Tax=Methanobacterium alcaliphilum TaxID=392018 RepID=UPI00200A219B|nr:hypothetical protein [Methanobacterium alcaliphilum]MCK9151718.1 hypothetical protein [Methanobacterium alcaliphilum]
MPIRQRGMLPIDSTQILFLLGKSGTLGIVKSGAPRMVFIGTPDDDEVVVYLEKEDLLVISAFGEGEIIEKGIKSMAYLLREIGSPIIVLDDDHPTSQRLKMVVAVGPEIRLDCNIIPGTHPEQDILCSCEDLSGVKLTATDDGVLIEGNVEKLKIENV